jgi:hypothetical protein
LDTQPLVIVAAVAGLIGLVFLAVAVVAVKNGKWLRLFACAAMALLFLAVGALAATVRLAVAGYQALTREEVAATVRTTRLADREFGATFRFADGHETSYRLQGDALYVDAHIVKWHPWANILGLHTSYELDRVAGRYHSLEEEQSRPRTVHSLAQPRPVDIFALAMRYPRLSGWVDAEYGSATFIPATDGAEFELRVSTTGLLFRPVAVKR